MQWGQGNRIILTIIGLNKSIKMSYIESKKATHFYGLPFDIRYCVQYLRQKVEG